MESHQGITITTSHVERLIAIEAGVHYGEPPPPGRDPFVIIPRPAKILLSAPHGARTYRNNHRQEWHEEDEYTAGIALLLSELFNAAVIATVWMTTDSDPNFSYESSSAYKRAIRELVRDLDIRWVLDLHGASQNGSKMSKPHLVDLGTREQLHSFPVEQVNMLRQCLETSLGPDSVSENVYPASEPGRTVTAFCHAELGVHAIQIELKPSVRVPFRRTDASSFAARTAGSGPYSAPPGQLSALLQALADFLGSL